MALLAGSSFAQQQSALPAAPASGKTPELPQPVKTPPVNQGLLGGPPAWRQHESGHTDVPNWSSFIRWADHVLNRIQVAPSASTRVPADQPLPRTDENSRIAHEQLVKRAKAGRIDVYFEGDSIVRRWGATDYPDLLANWNKNFFGWNAANFGWGADKTQNILWRLSNGELDGVNPKVIVLLAGTNNVGDAMSLDDPQRLAGDVANGIRSIVQLMQTKVPGSTIILTGILPRNDNMAFMPMINEINRDLAKIADGRKIRYLNINDKLADRDGNLFEGMMNPADKLHPTLKAYQIWADALKVILTDLLGPPAKDDYGPPATGDPSAQHEEGPRAL